MYSRHDRKVPSFYCSISVNISWTDDSSNCNATSVISAAHMATIQSIQQASKVSIHGFCGHGVSFIKSALQLLYSSSVPWVVSTLMCKHEMDLIGDHLCEVGCSPCIWPFITIEFFRSFYQGKCFWHLLKLKIYSAATWGGVCTTKVLNN